MRYSRQKELIYKALMEVPCHPTADELYTRLKEHHPNLSLATVYRNLNRFAEEGRILRLAVPGGSDRYDGTVSQHYHMVCRHCGRLTDVQEEEMPHVSQEIMALHQYDVTGFELVLYGVCEHCRATPQ